MTTRAEFLDRVRREMARTPGLFPARPAARPANPAAQAELIRRELIERWPQAIERFRCEFERVSGVLHVVPSLAAVPALVGRLAGERGVRRVVTWNPSALGADVGAALRAEGLEPLAMPAEPVDEAEEQRLREATRAADIGLTGADLAVAETGSLVLISGPGRPRSTSLLPEYHVAVFDRSVLVETLEQAGVLLEAWHATGRAAAGASITFITGPSRTADIELTLTRGVHGPREVHAVFVDGAATRRRSAVAAARAL